MNKRGSVWLALGVFLTLCLVILFFLYALFFGNSHDSLYQEAILTGHIVNPAEGLSVQEAESEFDEDFVHYLLVSLRAYNLHATPDGALPEIEVIVDDSSYTALVIEGRISVHKWKAEQPDLRLTMSKEEAVRILRDSSTIPDSFALGAIRFEKIADGSTLLFKGYFKVYPSLARGSMSGNVIRSYFSSED